MNRKVRYMYMPKDKKKEVRNSFKNTKVGKSAISLLNRLLIEGILCIGMGIIMLVSSIIDRMEWHYYALAIILIVAGIVFFIAQWFIRYAKYDKYVEQLNKKAK